MLYPKSLIFISVLFIVVMQSAWGAYDIADRFKLVSDKFHTERMFRPWDQRFNLDISVAANTNLKDVVDEGKDVSTSATTTNDKIANGLAFLNKYNNSEQYVNINFGVGIPFFDFKLWNIKVSPDLIRVIANVDALLAIRSAPVGTLADILPSNTPAEVKAIAAGIAVSGNEGADVMVLIAAASSDPIVDAYAAANTGKYFIPADLNDPNLFLYVKGDLKVGPAFRFTSDSGKWFGFFNLYGLGRLDRKVRISANTLAQNPDAISKALSENKNTQVSIAHDFRIGYQWDRYKIFASTEELKLFTLSDNKDEAGDLDYGYDPLFRLHGMATFQLPVFTIRPFVGMHVRSGYGIGDGFYTGAVASTYFWNDRIGFQFRGQIDSEHLTLVPRLKIWVLQLEYMLKQPIKSEADDNVKISTIHSINLRIMI